MQFPSPCAADVRHAMQAWPRECGSRLEHFRLAQGLSRAELARIVGSSEPTIHRVENGKLVPRDHLRVAISLALHVAVTDIWRYPDISPSPSTTTGEHHHG